MTTTTEVRLPSEEALRAAWTALADADEFHITKLVDRFRAFEELEDDDDAIKSVPLAEVGRLLVHLNEISNVLGYMQRHVGTMRHIVVDKIGPAAAGL